MVEQSGSGRQGRDRFEFEYTPSSGDFAALLKSQRNAPREVGNSRLLHGILVIVAWLVLVGAMNLLILWRIVEARSVITFIGGAFCAFMGMFVWRAWYYAYRYPRYVASVNRMEGRKHHVVVDASGLTSTYPGSSGHFDWSAVERVDEVDGRVFFWISGASFVIVPKSAFESELERAALVLAVKEWMNGKD